MGSRSQNEAYGFDWDDGNRLKCLKHGVSIELIEGVLRSPTLRVRADQIHSIDETRLQAYGRTQSGRHIFVVFTRRHKGGMLLIRPISARFMHEAEIDAFEEETSGFRLG